MPAGDTNERDERSRITTALSKAANGEAGASDQLMMLVYDELKTLARTHMAKLRAGQTLQATALVHEAWVRLGGGDAKAWDDRAHFFGAAANAMRNILVDHARAKKRLKRGGGEEPVELHTGIPAADGGPAIDILALDEALRQFEQEHERPARIVALRYFAGLTVPDVAELLGVSKRTVDREWLFARTWLRRALGESGTSQAE